MTDKQNENYDINKDPKAPAWLKDEKLQAQEMKAVPASDLPSDAPAWLREELTTQPSTDKAQNTEPSYKQVLREAMTHKKRTITDADRAVVRVIAQEDEVSAETQKRRVEGYSYLARQGFSQQEIAQMLVDRGMNQEKADKAVAVLKLAASDLVGKGSRPRGDELKPLGTTPEPNK